MLALAFEAPKELFEQFWESLRRIEEVSLYVARVDGAIVSTAVGFTVDGKKKPISARTVEEQARRWSPWRAYAVVHLWASA